MNKRFITTLSLILISLSTFEAAAQEKGKAVISQIKEFQKFFGTRDPLREALGTADKMKEEYYYTQQGLDLDTANLLRNLKDPFMSQLPRPPEPKETTQTSGSDQKEPIEPVADDKTRQPIKTTPPRPRLDISGLVWNSDRPQAIVNQRVVSVGDVVQQWTIVNISRDGIELNYDDETILIEP